MSAILLEADNLVKHYALPRAKLWRQPVAIHALAGVSFGVQPGRSLGIVGESGSGKSTLARLVMALERPDQGNVRFQGEDLNAMPREDLLMLRRSFQMVFQDPYGSLDPRQTIGRIVAEPLSAQGGTSRLEQRDAAIAMLQSVGLRAADAQKYPHEFSGGQRQRIAIARALVTRPKLIVADEPVSALDISVQAQVLNLLADLQNSFGVTYLFISHDLAVVEHVCDEVAVMYRGRIVEQGSPAILFGAAAHPYTRALIEAMPQLSPGARRYRQAPPMARRDAGAGGCPYVRRCLHAQPRCLAERPLLTPVAVGHLAACHFAADIRLLGRHDGAGQQSVL